MSSCHETMVEVGSGAAKVGLVYDVKVSKVEEGMEQCRNSLKVIL